jgi:hypothetical protein
MCGVKKGFVEDEKDAFRDAVSPAKFYCRKCLRVASRKKYLCKPEPLGPGK